jgi:dipeptidase E
MNDDSRDERTIFAIGGGGFSTLMNQYTLDLTRKIRPKVCFLPTASGDAEQYIENFYASYGAFCTQCTHVSLTRFNQPDPVAHLLEQDVIYVGGGNAFQMFLVWRAHGVDKALREAWGKGVVLTGLSAGSICWFSGATTDSWGLPLRVFNEGLGLLPSSHSPHYDSEPGRRDIYERSIANGDLPPGIAIEDHCGVLFRGTQLIESVCSVPGKTAYHVTRDGASVKSTPLPTRRLESPPSR